MKHMYYSDTPKIYFIDVDDDGELELHFAYTYCPICEKYEFKKILNTVLFVDGEIN